MENSELASRYFDVLEQAGFQPELASAEVVRFKHEGLFYQIAVDPDDVNFRRLQLPNIWCAPDEASRREALEVINEICASIKVAKLVMRSDGEAFSAVEIFLHGPEESAELLERCMAAVLAAARHFLGKMQQARAPVR